MGGRGDDAGVRRLLAALAAGARVRRRPRRALLRSEPGPQGGLRQPEPLAARAGAARPGRGAAAAADGLPHGVRPGDAGAPGAVAGHLADLDRCSCSSARTSRRSGWTASPPGWCAATRTSTRRRRRRCGCCRTSTPSGSARQPRGLLFPGRASERALAGSQAGNFPVLLLDGVVGGVWHQRRSGRRAVVTVEPLGRLTTRHTRRPGVEVERIGVILDARPELTVGTVSVGPHA